jgi:hypothetical protein
MILTYGFKGHKCVLISDSSYYGKFTGLVIDTSATVDVAIYSDSKCSKYVSSESVLSAPLVCTDLGDGSYYKGKKSTGVSTLTPGAGVTGAYIATYKTRAQCKTNNMANSAAISEYEFFGIGYCISGTDLNSGGDVMMTDCSGTTSSFDFYTSTDGSCSGDLSTQTYTQGDTCEGTVGDIYGLTYGYINFKCSA